MAGLKIRYAVQWKNSAKHLFTASDGRGPPRLLRSQDAPAPAVPATAATGEPAARLLMRCFGDRCAASSWRVPASGAAAAAAATWRLPRAWRCAGKAGLAPDRTGGPAGWRTLAALAGGGLATGRAVAGGGLSTGRAGGSARPSIGARAASSRRVPRAREGSSDGEAERLACGARDG